MSPQAAQLREVALAAKHGKITAQEKARVKDGILREALAGGRGVAVDDAVSVCPCVWVFLCVYLCVCVCVCVCMSVCLSLSLSLSMPLSLPLSLPVCVATWTALFVPPSFKLSMLRVSRSSGRAGLRAPCRGGRFAPV